jgi:hypothetical protein
MVRDDCSLSTHYHCTLSFIHRRRRRRRRQNVLKSLSFSLSLSKTSPEKRLKWGNGDTREKEDVVSVWNPADEEVKEKKQGKQEEIVTLLTLPNDCPVCSRQGQMKERERDMTNWETIEPSAVDHRYRKVEKFWGWKWRNTIELHKKILGTEKEAVNERLLSAQDWSVITFIWHSTLLRIAVCLEYNLVKIRSCTHLSDRSMTLIFASLGLKMTVIAVYFDLWSKV